jgi:hypothetical protein
MGDGRSPSGVALDTTEQIDDGTLARIGSPTPDPIGLDAPSGTTKPTAATMADQIVGYARKNRSHRVGDGECYTLANRALNAAGAKRASDYGTVTPDADYVWGTSVTLSELQPGDVIQFRNYSYEREIVIERSDETVTRQDAQDRPHHTAIVQSVDGNGAVTVWEQNAPDGSPVSRTQLFFTSGTSTHGNERTTIRVRGTFWFYRPVAR